MSQADFDASNSMAGGEPDKDLYGGGADEPQMTTAGSNLAAGRRLEGKLAEIYYAELVELKAIERELAAYKKLEEKRHDEAIRQHEVLVTYAKYVKAVMEKNKNFPETYGLCGCASGEEQYRNYVKDLQVPPPPQKKEASPRHIQDSTAPMKEPSSSDHSMTDQE